jgi:DNA-binding NtrC family response regulator
MSARLLLIEDDPSTASALGSVLTGEGYEVDTAGRGDQGLEMASSAAIDLVITDMRLPGLGGLELVKRLHDAKPKLPIILMTAHGTTETAIEATKLGAYDYILKPFEAHELLDLVAAAVDAGRLMSESVESSDTPAGQSALVGKSRSMQSIYKEIGRVAATPVTVLIRGETGTGKELIARAIYEHSDRTGQPFIAVNCAAIPETLLESELFGHERGAFTGAQARRVGRFEQADGGTIFLDEIGDLNPNTQAKLLRVLQERSIQRLGDNTSVPVNVRVIAATHRDLESAIREKQFREDLYYRLSVVTVTLPPLRERAEDIPELVRCFVRKYSKELCVESPSVQPEAIQYLQRQPWPGNVRELENAVRQALLLAKPLPVGLEHVQQAVEKMHRPAGVNYQSHSAYIADLLAAAQRGEIAHAYSRMIADLEHDLFRQAIQLAQGNLAKAARWLGVTRVKMREKLTELGLRPRRPESSENQH